MEYIVLIQTYLEQSTSFLKLILNKMKYDKME